LPDNAAYRTRAILSEVLPLLGYVAVKLEVWQLPRETDMSMAEHYNFDVEVTLYGATRAARGSVPAHIFDHNAGAHVARFILDRIGL
jgi:hypothetical protein